VEIHNRCQMRDRRCLPRTSAGTLDGTDRANEAFGPFRRLGLPCTVCAYLACASSASALSAFGSPRCWLGRRQRHGRA
jgi:hypothetical protein